MLAKTLQRCEQLIHILSDGKFHSGESIASDLKVSRSAVWKLIQTLRLWQLDIYAVTGRGYQLHGGLQLLNSETLVNQLKQGHSQFKNVILRASVDSTANLVAQSWRDNPQESCLVIAEHQSAGRGRKGRQWVSPFAANLYFSMGVAMPMGLSALGGVSLAIGICLAQTLNRYTTDKITIKWPNDLLVADKKLAGILLEASGDSNDQSFLNIGVGINWQMGAKQASNVDQPWINLKPLLKSQVSRSFLLAELILELEACLENYQKYGFKFFSEQWQKLSACYNKPVTVHQGNELINGVEQGVETNGALRLATEKGLQTFYSGEVSLRKKASDRYIKE